MSTRPNSFFQMVKTSGIPVLVDFYADWCGPCKMVSPAIERLSAELKGRVFTVKVNVDKKPQVAGAYQVASIPTIMLFSKGEPVMRLQGAYPYEQLKQEILKNL